jgi:hypothetical protein
MLKSELPPFVFETESMPSSTNDCTPNKVKKVRTMSCASASSTGNETPTADIGRSTAMSVIGSDPYDVLSSSPSQRINGLTSGGYLRDEYLSGTPAMNIVSPSQASREIAQPSSDFNTFDDDGRVWQNLGKPLFPDPEGEFDWGTQLSQSSAGLHDEQDGSPRNSQARQSASSSDSSSSLSGRVSAAPSGNRPPPNSPLKRSRPC